MDYPLHLGVTEAGDAEDGRIKSALGIGALLHDSIGDTVRVSLSEPPENEVPVAALLCDIVAARSADPIPETGFRPLPGVPADYSAESRAAHPLSHLFPLATHADRALIEAFADTELFEAAAGGPNAVGNIAYMIDKAVSQGERRPVLARIAYDCADLDELRIRAAADFGALLLGGYCSGIAVECVNFPSDVLARLELDILQAARMRVTKTEYIACPGCGRTLFDLQSTLHEVKKSHSASSCRTQDRGDGMHRQWSRRDGGCRLRLCRCGSGPCEHLPRKGVRSQKHTRGRGASSAARPYRQGSAGCGHKIALIQRNKITTIIPYNLIS